MGQNGYGKSKTDWLRSTHLTEAALNEPSYNKKNKAYKQLKCGTEGNTYTNYYMQVLQEKHSMNTK